MPNTPEDLPAGSRIIVAMWRELQGPNVRWGEDYWSKFTKFAGLENIDTSK